MLVYNNFTNDSRVQKEAETLIQEGYGVTVLALLDSCTQPFEERNNIEIVRINIDPLHLRFLRWISSLGKRRSKPSTPDLVLLSRKINHYLGYILIWPIAQIKKNLGFRVFLYRIITGKQFVYALKTLFYIAAALGIIHLLYAPQVMAFVERHDLVVYVTLAILIFLRNTIYTFLWQTRRILGDALRRMQRFFSDALRRMQRFFSDALRRMQRFFSDALKKRLMPFHRHFCFASFYKKAFQYTAGKDYSVYHAHDLNTLPAAWLAARRDKARLVYDSHELYVDRNKLYPSSRFWKFILHRMEGFLVHRCDAVFTVNDSLANELARRYKIPRPGVVMNTPARFKKADIHLLGNARLRSELSISNRRSLLIYVGSITFNRGLEELILSLEHLPDCHLVYMGYGNNAYKQILMELAQKTGVRDRFSFFGPVPSNQVIHYAAGADLGVAPIANACLSYYLCSPNKLFEYMNAGLPVIASNFPELEKVVLGHKIGLTFDPADPPEIARSARKILDNPNLAAKMRQNALNASGQYNWGNEARKLVGIYRGL